MSDIKRSWEVLLVACTPAALANSVGINCRSSATNSCADRSAFASACRSTNCSTRTGADSGCQFVAVLLPEATPMFVAITDTTRVRVRIVSVTVSKLTARSAKSRRCHQ